MLLGDMDKRNDSSELKRVLRGDSVLLRPLVEQDLTTRAFWMMDSELLSMMGYPKSIAERKINHNEALAESHKWLKKRMERNDYVWGIDQNGKLIGDITAHIYESQKRAELYIVIGDKDMWGKGLGKEACILVLDEIFGSSDLYYVDTYISPENIRSLSLALSLGFTTFGTQTGGTKVLRLIRKSWETRRRRQLSSL